MKRKMTLLLLTALAAGLCGMAILSYEPRRFEISSFGQDNTDLFMHYWENRKAVGLYIGSTVLFGIVLGLTSKSLDRSPAIAAFAILGPTGFVAGLAYLLVRSRGTRVFV